MPREKEGRERETEKKQTKGESGGPMDLGMSRNPRQAKPTNKAKRAHAKADQQRPTACIFEETL